MASRKGSVSYFRNMLSRSFAGLVIGIRLGLGIALLWAGASKLLRPFDFLDNIYAYELVGPHLGLFIGIVLPILEMVAATCLLSGLFLGGALAVSVLLTAMFVSAQIFAIHRGLAISCGCFGDGSDGTIGLETLSRAVLLLLMGIVGLSCHLARGNQQQEDHRHADPPEVTPKGAIGMKVVEIE